MSEWQGLGRISGCPTADVLESTERVRRTNQIGRMEFDGVYGTHGQYACAVLLVIAGIE